MRGTVVVAGGLLAAVLVAYPVAMSGGGYFTFVLGAVALVGFLVAFATGRWIFAGPAALAFLGAYAAALVIDGGRLDQAAPAVGFALLLLLELGDLASLMARGGSIERASLAARVRYVLVVCSAGFFVSFGAWLAAGWLGGDNYVLMIAGAAFGLGAIALTVLLARRAVGTGAL